MLNQLLSDYFSFSLPPYCSEKNYGITNQVFHLEGWGEGAFKDKSLIHICNLLVLEEVPLTSDRTQNFKWTELPLKIRLFNLHPRFAASCNEALRLITMKFFTGDFGLLVIHLVHGSLSHYDIWDWLRNNNVSDVKNWTVKRCKL